MTSVVLWTVPAPRSAGGAPVPSPEHVGGPGKARAAAAAAAAASGPAAAPDSAGGDAVPPAVPAVVVVAGAGHCGIVSELVGPLPAQPGGAHLAVRFGAPGGRAYIPGHRRPRELTVDGVIAGPSTRPPRHVVLTRPVELLRYTELVLAPPLPPSVAGTELLADAVRCADGLMYVLDAGEPLAPERRDELAAAAAVARRLVLVDTSNAPPPERAAIIRQVPALRDAPCYPAADPEALRTALVGWPGSEAGAVAAAPGVPAAAVAPRPTTITDDDVRWRAALEGELATAAATVHRQLSADLAALEMRCAVEPGALPEVFDIELHALSLRTTVALDRAARGLIAAVFAEVVPDGAAGPVLAGLTAAVARELDPDDRTFLITATAGVAVVRGEAAGLFATSTAPATVLPPVRVAVSGNCHLMWRYRGVPDKTEGRRWLRQAVQAVGRDLGRVLDQRFVALGGAIGELAADVVDHGVLLV